MALKMECVCITVN